MVAGVSAAFAPSALATFVYQSTAGAWLIFDEDECTAKVEISRVRLVRLRINAAHNMPWISPDL
jgi:hypothetical protein